MLRRPFLGCGVAAILLTTARAQATHVVGPGAHPDVNTAIAVASPGDVIRVLPGTYPGFQLSKGLTVRADVPGTVTLTGLFPSFVQQVPPGQSAHLVGLRLSSVAISGGTVSLDECDITTAGLAVTGDAVVSAQGCTIASQSALLTGSAALVVIHAEVTLTGCTVQGAPLGLGTASPAISLAASRLHGSHLQVQAGAGAVGVAAIAGDNLSEVWLADSSVTADPTACALAVPGARHDRCTLVPSCGSVPNGFLLGVRRPQPLQNGTTFVLEFTAQPGMAVGVFAAPTFARQLPVELEQSLLLPSGAFALGAAIANAQGVATSAWPVPAGPVVVDQVLWLQGFSGFAWPLQASPLVGGVVR